MLIYLVTFSASFFFAFLARKYSRTCGKAGFWIFSAISVALLILLAGLRDYSIGIDVKNYMNFPIYWRGASHYSTLSKYLRYYLADGNKEILFALMIGLVAKITGEYRVFLFLAHTIIVTCIYIGAVRERKYIRFEFVPLFFCLLFFSHSMNIMRQYIAMSILFAFFADIEQRRYVRYSIAVLIAMLIHTSAILMILPMGYYIILYDWQPKKKRRVKNKSLSKLIQRLAAADKTGTIERLTIQDASFTKKIVLCGCIFVGEMLFTTAMSILISMGYLNDKYSYYLDSREASAGIIVTGMLLIELCGVLLLWKDMRAKNPRATFWLMCTITDLAFQQLSSQMAYGKRIAGSFSLLNLLTLSLMVSASPKRDKRILVTITVIAFALLYWGYIYIYRNASQTYPYQFGIF